MSNFSESFHQAHRAHINWQEDRPLIDEFNHSDIRVALDLLYDEIDELNGGDEVGLFSKDNIREDHVLREDYRQQEISDIIVFVFTAYDKLGEEVDMASVESRVTALAGEYQFNIPEPALGQFPPKALTEPKNDVYKTLRQKLNDEAEKVKAFNPETDTQESLIQSLESILVYTVAMHSLIGVNSSKAVMEKIARNIIKYPANRFAMPEGDLTDEELKAHYDAERTACSEEFEGEYDPELGDRPKTGTTEFYVVPEPIEYEPGEARQIGIWYRAAAQIIASSYGFSVRVSNLLNRNKV
jgi:hypothetical protein